MADSNTDENDRSGGEPVEGTRSGATGDAQPAGEAGDDAALLAETDLGTDAAAMTSLLGPERWVQFGFIALGFVVFFVADKLVTLAWEQFAEPDPMITATSAGILGLLGAFFAYRHPQSRKLADEVVAELSQVTWPSREETYTSTIVVVVTSVAAAAYTGVFDAIWSAITDYVYTI
jgi:preprotein translocase SecE subunit